MIDYALEKFLERRIGDYTFPLSSIQKNGARNLIKEVAKHAAYGIGYGMNINHAAMTCNAPIPADCPSDLGYAIIKTFRSICEISVEDDVLTNDQVVRFRDSVGREIGGVRYGKNDILAQRMAYSRLVSPAYANVPGILSAKSYRELFMQDWAPGHIQDYPQDKLMFSPDGSIIERHSAANARDLKKAGWRYEHEMFCDACKGVGDIDGEVCWHCEGERYDPTKL